MKSKNINILKINNKTQKGVLPFHNKKGYLITEGSIALRLKKSLIITTTQLKDIKISISKSIPKDIKKIMKVTPLLPISKRQGVRMGKGKGKIKHISNRFPKYFNLFNICIKNIKMKDINKLDNKYYTNVLKEKNKFLYIILNLKKIIIKYPFLKINILNLS